MHEDDENDNETDPDENSVKKKYVESMKERHTSGEGFVVIIPTCILNLLINNFKFSLEFTDHLITDTELLLVTAGDGPPDIPEDAGDAPGPPDLPDPGGGDVGDDSPPDLADDGGFGDDTDFGADGSNASFDQKRHSTTLTS